MELGLEFLNSKAQKELTEKFEKGELEVKPTEAPIKEDIEIEEKIEENPKKTPSTGDTPSPYVPFAKVLVDEGVLPESSLEDFDGTIDSLVDKMRNQIDTLSNGVISKFDPSTQDFIKMLESGIPTETAKAFAVNEKTLNSITPEVLEDDEKLQENIVREYYKNILEAGEDEIDEQIEYFKDRDLLSSKALSFHGKLKTRLQDEKAAEIQRVATEKAENQKAIAKQLEELRTSIDTKDEIIPGIKLSKAQKDRIYKNLTTPVGLDEKTNRPVSFVEKLRAKDPVKFEIILNYLADQGIFEGKFDTLIKGTKSKATEELEKVLATSEVYSKSGVAAVAKRSNEENVTDTQKLMDSFPSSLNDLFKSIKK